MRALYEKLESQYDQILQKNQELSKSILIKEDMIAVQEQKIQELLLSKITFSEQSAIDESEPETLDKETLPFENVDKEKRIESYSKDVISYHEKVNHMEKRITFLQECLNKRTVKIDDAEMLNTSRLVVKGNIG